MEKKKLGFFILLFSLFLIIPGTTYAKETIVNYNNISISETEYENLINLGFTDTEIMFMEQDTFDANKDIEAVLVSEEITNLDEFDNIIINNSGIGGYSLLGYTEGYIQTPYKKLRTTISYLSSSNRYRYKTTLDWINMPSTRSYDIIGLGMDSSVSAASGLSFKQYYTQGGTYYSSYSYIPKIGSVGMGASFELPSGSLTQLGSYIYYDVQKNSGTVYTQHAYGDYAHATSSVTSSQSQSYNITTAIFLNSGVSGYYDSMDEAIATWTGTW